MGIDAKMSVALVVSLALIYVFWGLVLFDTDASWFEDREEEINNIVYSVIPIPEDVKKEMDAKKKAWELIETKTPKEIAEIAKREVKVLGFSITQAEYNLLSPYEREDFVAFEQSKIDADISNLELALSSFGFLYISKSIDVQEYSEEIEKIEEQMEFVEKKQKLLHKLGDKNEELIKKTDKIKAEEAVEEMTWYQKAGYKLSKPFVEMFAWMSDGLKGVLEPIMSFFDTTTIFFGKIWGNLIFIWQNSYNLCSSGCSFLTFSPTQETNVFGVVDKRSALYETAEEKDLAEIPEILRLGVIAYVGIAILLVAVIPIIEHLPFIGGK